MKTGQEGREKETMEIQYRRIRCGQPRQLYIIRAGGEGGVTHSGVPKWTAKTYD
jgi:hypothetical protein